jgi:membrane protein required for colicin V production
MILDIFCLFIFFLAILKGLKNGLILAVFAFSGYLLAVFFAAYFGGTIATTIQQNAPFARSFLPVLSFIFIFLLVLILVRLLAKTVEKAFEFVMLGWLNKLCGIVLYTLIYLFIYSLLINFLIMTRWIQKDTVSYSYCYDFIQQLAPAIFSWVIKFWPSLHDATQSFKSALSSMH